MPEETGGEGSVREGATRCREGAVKVLASLALIGHIVCIQCMLAIWIDGGKMPAACQRQVFITKDYRLWL